MVWVEFASTNGEPSKVVDLITRGEYEEGVRYGVEGEVKFVRTREGVHPKVEVTWPPGGGDENCHIRVWFGPSHSREACEFFGKVSPSAQRWWACVRDSDNDVVVHIEGATSAMLGIISYAWAREEES